MLFAFERALPVLNVAMGSVTPVVSQPKGAVVPPDTCPLLKTVALLNILAIDVTAAVFHLDPTTWYLMS